MAEQVVDYAKPTTGTGLPPLPPLWQRQVAWATLCSAVALVVIIVVVVFLSYRATYIT